MNKIRLSLSFCLPLFFILLFSSCSEPQVKSNPNFPQFSDTLSVDVGFPHQISTFDYNNKTYIYCYDLVTYKKVKLYDQDFNFIKTFSVDYFSDLGLYLKDIEMITPDSVVLLTDNNANTLISLNLASGKNKRVALNELVKLSNIKVPLEFHTSFYYGFRLNKSILFLTSPSISGVSVMYPRDKPIDGIKVYDSISKLLPLFIKITQPFDEPKIELIEKSQAFQKELSGRYEYFQTNYFISDNEIIHTPSSIDFFDIYDLSNSKTKEAKIKSKYTDISIPNRTWKEIDNKPEVLYQDLPLRDLNDAGKVVRMYLDKKNKRYNVFLYYSKNKRPENDTEMQPFVWQVYDLNFNLIDEREHKKFDSDCTELFSTKKHLYLPYYNEATYDPEKAVLLRYTF